MKSQVTKNIDAEQSVLGALLLRPSMFPEVSRSLIAEDFTRSDHRKIFQAMVELTALGDPIDYQTVYLHLENGIDPTFLTGLTENVGDSSNAPYYARMVREASDRRRMISLTSRLVKALESGQRVEALLSELQSFSLPDPASNISPAILEMDDFLKLDLPPRTAHIHPWLYDPSINMIYGDRGIGKTQFALGLCDSIVCGAPFGPWAGGQPVNCLYLDGELVAQDIADRLKELGSNDRKGRIYIYSDDRASSLNIRKANLNSEEWRRNLKAFLLEKQVKVWVADNIASLAPGIDENSKQDWDPINQWFLELRFAGITTIFLHHTSKEGLQRGTAAREDNIDISIMLDWPKDYEIGEGARFITKFKKARVKQEYTHLLKDTEFVLLKDEAGKLIWTWGDVKEKQIMTFLKLRHQGLNQTEIAETMGVDKSTVTRAKQKAIKAGYYTENGEITQSGYALIS
jgi:hypothetical protein